MRLRFCIFSALFLSLLALRLGTLQCAFQADDSPETAAASALAGIQHPPGYPLPSLLGRLASLSLPGNPALAQNILAAAWGCLAAALLFVILAQLSSDWPLALVIALGFGLMPQLGYQSASAKGGIYTLNLALTLGSLSCLWLAQRGREAGMLCLAFLLAGLGLAGHYMSLVLFAPAFAVWSRGHWKKALLWTLPGLSLYFYLPLRAAWQPGMNWGDPETLQRLWYTLSRAQYAGAENSRNLDGALRLARHFFSLLSGQVPWPFLMLSPLGIWLAWKSRSWQLKPLLAAFTLHWLAVVFYNNPPAQAPWVIDAFFLPDFALFWLFSGLGLWMLLLRFSQYRVWLLAAAAGLVLALAPAKIRSVDYSQDTLAYDYARDLQQLLPKDAVLLAAGGGDAFAFWYLQQVEKRRPDLTLVDVPLLSDWYLQSLAPRLPQLRPEWQTRDAVVGGLLAAQSPKPLYYSSHNPGDRGIPFALVSLAPAPGRQVPLSAPILAAPWASLRMRFLNDSRTPADGNRAELMEYYPASALALADFAKRYQNPPLQQFGELMARRFRPAIH